MKKFFSIMIATWFGTGLIPPIILKGMAGTYGSFFSLPLCYLLIAKTPTGPYGLIIYFLATLSIYAVGLLVVTPAEKYLGPRTDYKGKTKYRDQNQIVIDEVLGMLITCAPMVSLPHTWWAYFAAFGLFRLFDIAKIWPTKHYDRLHSAYGVMTDDFVAGIYASLCLTALLVLFYI